MIASVVEHGLRPRETATGAECEHGPLGISARKEDASMDT
jgi:hypothetical protein